MTVHRGLPNGAMEAPAGSDGWYQQLWGDKEWVGPFSRANEAQGAYATAKVPG